MTEYKWANPQAWLLDRAETWSREELFAALHDLALCLDADSIQDLFQEAMDADGYFQERETT
jgi:hypothetical protein